MEIGDFVKVPSKTSRYVIFGVINDIIHNNNSTYYEVVFFNGESEILLSDRVERINENR